jgi:linoleate 10R-lipoxygenase
MIVGQVLRAVFGFDGLRRGPGLSGTLKRHKVTEGEKNTLLYEYLGSDNLPTPWPNSMIVQMNSEVEYWDVIGV